MVFMDSSSAIFLAGHRGMVGSALLRLFQQRGYSNIITASKAELNLLRQQEVENYFTSHKVDIVVLAAAKVGGILINSKRPADFLFENLEIQNNVIEAARKGGVKMFVFLGSSCIYPRLCPQPMKEEHLLSGPLEPTNEGYSLAKIAGLRLVQYYDQQYGMKGICPMPCNMYGPNDSWDLERSHVLSALVRKFTEATDTGKSEVVLWGTGSAKREFLHVDDCARAILLLMEKGVGPHTVNVGSGSDISIRELAEIVSAKAGFKGKIVWDSTKPDGMPLKLLDVSKLKALGFEPQVKLLDGIDFMITDCRHRRKEGLLPPAVGV